MRNKLLMVAAAGAALALPSIGLGSPAPRVYDGERGELHRKRRIAAYKRQRTANRLRRKLLSR